MVETLSVKGVGSRQPPCDGGTDDHDDGENAYRRRRKPGHTRQETDRKLVQYGITDHDAHSVTIAFSPVKASQRSTATSTKCGSCSMAKHRRLSFSAAMI